MGDRQDQFTGTKAVSGALAINPVRIETYLSEAIEGFSGPLTISQFKGGQSNPTYLLDTPDAKYVLRRKPPGRLLPSAHAVDREFRVIGALRDSTVPVPYVYHLCTDESIAGTMFYVMSYAQGRVLWETLLPGMEPNDRRQHYNEMNRIIAALHNVNVAEAGLSDFGKPGNYFERQTGRWSGQYRASETEDIPDMNRLIDWLPAALPDEGNTDEISIVHGDFRIDNIVFHATGTHALAVLDWELSTLGHPLADFTYHLMLWRLPPTGFPGMAGADLEALGIPDEEEYTAMYCARTGRAGIENLDYYMAYNAFRIAAILQGIAGRVRDGTATSPRARTMAASVRPLAALAWSFAEQAGT